MAFSDSMGRNFGGGSDDLAKALLGNVGNLSNLAQAAADVKDKYKDMAKALNRLNNNFLPEFENTIKDLNQAVRKLGKSEGKKGADKKEEYLFNIMTMNTSAITNVSVMKEIKNKLISNQFDHVIALCNEKGCFFSKIMAAGVNSRRYGLQFMLESMKSEGKRTSVSFWQRLNLLHDIAIIAPMIGLLGTVLGMFYAFYDLNRSFESISSLFDGLGISVGTTVAGIFVAILAMILHSASKYRLVKSLTFVESEAVALAHLIDSNKNS